MAITIRPEDGQAMAQEPAERPAPAATRRAGGSSPRGTAVVAAVVSLAVMTSIPDPRVGHRVGDVGEEVRQQDDDADDQA